jgi:septum formation protein
LSGLGLRFQVRPQKVDETRIGDEPAAEYALRLAGAKARAGAEPGELVLGADTVVLIDSALLGKPRDPQQAREMLRHLSGREHSVLTAVAVYEPGASREVSTLEQSRVRMASLTDEEIDWYVETREPLDKAGAYAVQGLGGMFVEAVFGNYTNVVGLPLPATYRLFRELGYDLRSFIAPTA